MAGGVITLITDFGLSDHYVGVVKGVILARNPEARIVDLCHGIEPYDRIGAALALAVSYPYFPEGAVHVVIVDPGVGSSRRAIAAQAAGALFVAPDNGVLELVYRRHAHRVWALRAEEFALRPVSRTFHGRDVFAPAAALLSRGVAAETVGDPVEDYVRLEIPSPRTLGPGRVEGRVLKADRFGNLITNLAPSDLPPQFQISIGGATIRNLRTHYEAAAEGELFAIEGSSGYIEISMKQNSAAAALGVGPGAVLEVRG